MEESTKKNNYESDMTTKKRRRKKQKQNKICQKLGKVTLMDVLFFLVKYLCNWDWRFIRTHVSLDQSPPGFFKGTVLWNALIVQTFFCLSLSLSVPLCLSLSQNLSHSLFLSLSLSVFCFLYVHQWVFLILIQVQLEPLHNWPNYFSKIYFEISFTYCENLFSVPPWNLRVR